MSNKEFLSVMLEMKTARLKAIREYTLPVGTSAAHQLHHMVEIERTALRAEIKVLKERLTDCDYVETESFPPRQPKH